ncbi:MAG: hypothetical protein RR396_05415, partial [Clostridiales bacterium]
VENEENQQKTLQQELTLAENIQNQEKLIVTNKRKADILAEDANSVQLFLGQLTEEENALGYQLHGLNSRLNMLKEMAERYDSYFPGVKSILLAKKQNIGEFQGVIGAVAALMDVPEEYSLALETYLGSSVQNIITKSEADAKKAIAYLKSKKAGRATFLPLDILQVRRKGDFSAALSIAGVLGRGSELVKCREEIRPAIDFLLNNILLTANMEAASQAARALSYRYSIVTLEGDILHPGASISGGSRNPKNNDFLSRRNQIKKLALQTEELQTLLKLKQEKITVLKEKIYLLQQNKQKIDADILNQENALRLLEKEREELLFNLKSLQKQNLTLLNEIEDINEQNRDILIYIQNIEKDLLAQEEENQQISGQLQVFQEQLQEKQSSFEGERDDMTRYKVDLAKDQQVLKGIDNDLAKILSEKDHLEQEIALKRDYLASCEKNLADLQEKSLISENEVDQKEKSLFISGKELDGKRVVLAEKNLLLQALQKQL